MHDQTDPESKALASRAVTSLPMLSGESYQHIGKFAGAAVIAAFEMTGGVARLASWADTNYTDFATKLFPKVIQRSQQVDVTATLTIDDAIARLEQQNSIPSAEFTEVEDGEFYDL